MSEGPLPKLDDLVAKVLDSVEFEELFRTVMTELKRTGDLLHAEDDFHGAISQSAKDGKLAQLHLGGVPSDMQKQKKRAEVKKEIEKVGLAQLDRKIQHKTGSAWVSDSVASSVHRILKQMMDDARHSAAADAEGEEGAEAIGKKQKIEENE